MERGEWDILVGSSDPRSQEIIKNEQNRNHKQTASWKKQKSILEVERWQEKAWTIWEKRSYRFLQDFFNLRVRSHRRGLLICVTLFMWNRCGQKMSEDQDCISKIFPSCWEGQSFFSVGTDNQEKAIDKNNKYYRLALVVMGNNFVIGPFFPKILNACTQFPHAHTICVSASVFS